MLSGTIHLHLIKFSLLLPVTSTVTAPARIKTAGIFHNGRQNATVSAQLWGCSGEKHTLAAWGIKCLILQCRRFWGEILISSVTLQSATKSIPSGLCPSSCPSTGEWSRMSLLFLLSAELEKCSPGASQRVFSSRMALGNCPSTQPFLSAEISCRCWGPCCTQGLKGFPAASPPVPAEEGTWKGSALHFPH